MCKIIKHVHSNYELKNNNTEELYKYLSNMAPTSALCTLSLESLDPLEKNTSKT